MRRIGVWWRHAVVAVVSAAAFAITFVAGVLTTTGQWAEQAILESSRFAYDQPLLKLVTVPNLIIACVTVAVIALLRRNVMAAIAGVAMIGVSSVLAQIFKHGILDRPALASLGDNTFPSGHMTAFTAVLFALLVVVPPRMRAAVAVVGVAVVSVVGFLLLDLGWHRPSDIFGAILLATCVSALLHLLAPGRRPVRPGRPIVVVLLVAGVGAAVLAVASLLAFQQSLFVGLASPMLSAQLTSVGMVLVGVAANLWLLRHPRGHRRR